VPWYCWKIWNAKIHATARRAATLLLLVLLAQLALGIGTLLLGVPVALGAAHQGGAMVVLAVLLWLNHTLRVQRTAGGSA